MKNYIMRGATILLNVVSNLCRKPVMRSFHSIKVRSLFMYITRKTRKSQEDKYVVLGSHYISPKCEMNGSGSIFPTTSMGALAVCEVVPSCWYRPVESLHFLGLFVVQLENVKVRIRCHCCIVVLQVR